MTECKFSVLSGPLGDDRVQFSALSGPLGDDKSQRTGTV